MGRSFFPLGFHVNRDRNSEQVNCVRIRTFKPECWNTLELPPLFFLCYSLAFNRFFWSSDLFWLDDVNWGKNFRLQVSQNIKESKVPPYGKQDGNRNNHQTEEAQDSSKTQGAKLGVPDQSALTNRTSLFRAKPWNFWTLLWRTVSQLSSSCSFHAAWDCPVQE